VGAVSAIPLVLVVLGMLVAGGKDDVRIGPELRRLYEGYVAAQGSGRPFTPDDPLVAVADGCVVIDAVAAADVETLRADLVALGMRGAVAAGRIVSGQLPVAAIGALAGLPSLRFARAAARETQGAGSERSP
jgi:hypothetical protein